MFKGMFVLAWSAILGYLASFAPVDIAGPQDPMNLCKSNGCFAGSGVDASLYVTIVAQEEKKGICDCNPYAHSCDEKMPCECFIDLVITPPTGGHVQGPWGCSSTPETYQIDAPSCDGVWHDRIFRIYSGPECTIQHWVESVLAFAVCYKCSDHDSEC